ncbi:MAG TPA: dephospho-CoA kinase, partial [Epsilonproteobacteria bacterium]|nr:dephospho-CoA kinase [Campylobacterota bacterium]
VAKFFTLFGFTVIDADRISHKILQMQQETIGQLFGKNLIVEGKVDRKALGRIIFSDKQKRTELEALLHPLIFDEIKRLSTEEEKLQQPYFVDIPIFFANGRYPIEKSLVVYTPKYIQLKRLVLRDGYNEEEALRRIETQIDVEEKRKRATYIIDNTDDLIALKHECMRVKEKIEKDFS